MTLAWTCLRPPYASHLRKILSYQRRGLLQKGELAVAEPHENVSTTSRTSCVYRLAKSCINSSSLLVIVYFQG